MKRKFIFLFLFVLSLGYMNTYAQLAGGTYTINSAVPTGGTNYISFSAAVTAMGSGITGPVVFNVAAGSGPYVEQVTIGNITGASATNTIKFNGNGATVQYNTTASYAGVLQLNGAKFVKIDSLTFQSTNVTYGIGANIYNACSTDSITRCTFDLTAVTNTSSLNSGVRVASAATSASISAAGANNLYFAKNKIICGTASGGPYYGIYLYGTNSNCIIEKNFISNFYYMGIYLYYTGSNNSVLDNEIARATKTVVGYGYGVYAAYASTTGANSGLRIERNKIHSLGGTLGTAATSGCYPLYFASLQGTAASPVVISNNIAYNLQLTPAYSIYCYNNAYTNIYHNTITVDSAQNTAIYMYGFYLYTLGTTEFKNNILKVTGGGTTTKNGIYAPSGWSGPPLERNMIYINSSQAGTQYYANYNGTNYNDLASFQTAVTTQQAGAVSVNPNFVAAATGNLAPTNTAMFANGVNLQTAVPTDFIGQVRLSAPAPGAFEFQASGTNNAGMVALTAPLGKYCPGPNAVKASIYNAGTNNITTVAVNWSLNGVVQTPVTYNQTTLATLTSTTGSPVGTLTLGNANLVAGVPVIVKIWTSNPNGAADVINTNDTLTATIQAVSLTIDAYRDTVCLNKGAAIALTPGAGFDAGALQWQSSTNSGGTWNPILGSDVTNYATPGLTANSWFRVKMTSGANSCYSDTAKIYTTNPQILTHTGDTSRCGAGTMTLNATNSSNSQIKWYDDAAAIDPIATGSQFVTPYLGSTTSYWVSAGIPNAQPTPVNVVSGTQTTSTGSYMPFYYYNAKTKAQYIITAAELMAQGYAAGNINSIGLQLTVVGTPLVEGATISIGSTTATTMTGFVGGLQQVYYAATYNLVVNVTNFFDFQTPYYWDGVSNIVVSFCKNGSAGSAYNNYVCRYTSGSNNMAYMTSTTDICATTAGASLSYYRPHMILKMTSACETPKQKIDVVLHPVPVVDLGPDMNKCIDNGGGEVLDAGLQPNNAQYLWDNGTSSQVRAVFQSGDYSVKVTNQFNCADADTVKIILRKNPEVKLGNDTVVCNGVALGLDAGNQGIEYFWNTGATTQVVHVTSSGSYVTFVTNSAGCTVTDTINVTMQGELPTIQGIQVTNNGAYRFHFTAVNPQNVIGYSWDFGDGSTPSYEMSPSHDYLDNGDYTVVLHLSSTCGFTSDTLSAHIVGIRQIQVSNDVLNVYPNPTRDMATIALDGTLKMKKIEVYNVLGQVVHKADAQSESKHVLSLTGMASGVYTIQVYTDKGTVSRKIEVIK